MSDLVGNPEDRFSRITAHIWSSHNNHRVHMNGLVNSLSHVWEDSSKRLISVYYVL